jgi:hypothetical protein
MVSRLVVPKIALVVDPLWKSRKLLDTAVPRAKFPEEIFTEAEEILYLLEEPNKVIVLEAPGLMVSEVKPAVVANSIPVVLALVL